MPDYQVLPDKELIRPEIVPRDLTFYLAMEDDLRSVASSNKLGNVLSLIASLLWGAFISVFLAIGSSASIPSETLAVLKTYRGFFFAFAVVFSLLAVYFILKTGSAIRQIKTSSWRPGNE